MNTISKLSKTMAIALCALALGITENALATSDAQPGPEAEPVGTKISSGNVTCSDCTSVGGKCLDQGVFTRCDCSNEDRETRRECRRVLCLKYRNQPEGFCPDESRTKPKPKGGFGGVDSGDGGAVPVRPRPDLGSTGGGLGGGSSACSGQCRCPDGSMTGQKTVTESGTCGCACTSRPIIRE